MNGNEEFNNRSEVEDLGAITAAITAGMALGQPHDLGDGRAAFLLPAGAVLQVVDVEAQREKLSDNPRRKIGTRALATAASFIAYVNAHSTGATAIYADKKLTKFKAVFNDHAAEKRGDPAAQAADAVRAESAPKVEAGDLAGGEAQTGGMAGLAAFLVDFTVSPRLAGWGDFGASYDCPVSVEWARWFSKSQHATENKQGMKHDAFVAFLEDNLVDIVRPEAGAVLGAVRSFEAKKDVKFASAVRLQNGDVSFKYTDETVQVGSNEGTLTMPEQITICIPVFEGGPRYEVDVRIRYRIGQGGLSLWFELVRPHKVLEHAFNSVVDTIRAGVGSTPIYDV